MVLADSRASRSDCLPHTHTHTQGTSRLRRRHRHRYNCSHRQRTPTQCIKCVRFCLPSGQPRAHITSGRRRRMQLSGDSHHASRTRGLRHHAPATSPLYGAVRIRARRAAGARGRLWPHARRAIAGSLARTSRPSSPPSPRGSPSRLLRPLLLLVGLPCFFLYNYM